jgi:iron complex transport system ATP-binding protein
MKLIVRDLAVGYRREEPVQRFMNFSVSEGDVCCVLGPNGCGKSTLFRTVLGLLPVIDGSITIDGDDVTRWSSARLAQTMAYVAQQHTPPFALKVKDVVMMGRTSKLGPTGQPSPEDYSVVENAMNDMGIHHLRDMSYTDISGGELQMTMIARALAQEPRILVLDEPTAALDYGNAMRVIARIRNLAERGYAVLMTTHSPDHAFMCSSNVALMQRYETLKFGSAIQVITAENMRSAYGLEVQVVEFTDRNGEVLRMCAPQFECDRAPTKRGSRSR